MKEKEQEIDMLEYEKHITKHCGISETQICLNKCKCGALTNREQCYSCWRKTHLSKDWLKKYPRGY